MIEPVFAIHVRAFLLLYGSVMYAISPGARNEARFVSGSDDAGDRG